MTWKRIACCESCWTERNGARVPVKLVPADVETCHYCKLETTSGIYTRESVDVRPYVAPAVVELGTVTEFERLEREAEKQRKEPTR